MNTNAKRHSFFSRRKVKQEARSHETYPVHDATSSLFKEMVAEDNTLRVTLIPSTSQIIHGLTFFVHPLDTYTQSFPMFEYGPEEVTEWNKLSLGSSGLRACLENISAGYTQGVLSKQQPLYVLESDFLAACARAKTIQSRYPNEHVAIFILDINSLERDVVSASHAFKTLGVATPTDFHDKMLVWVEERDVGTAEKFRPLQEAVLTVMDWRRLQLSRIGMKWFTELRRAPETCNQPTSTEVTRGGLISHTSSKTPAYR
jgi:hypothetical protein